MGKVIELRDAAKSHRGIRAVLESLLKRQKTGEIHAYMHMISTSEGTELVIEGDYAERLQHASFALVKALNEVADRIAISGTAGNTSSQPLYETVKRRPSRQSGFGRLR